MSVVWIVGGSGRTGRAVAEALGSTDGDEVVLVGRDAARLRHAAPVGAKALVAGSTGVVAALRRHRPDVVFNTVGPFTDTAAAVVEACLAIGCHYVDVANDLAAVLARLAGDEDARAAGSVVVTAAGFGAVAAESLVLRLVGAPRRPPSSVRVDVIPSVRADGGSLGEALAGTMTMGLSGVPGGRRFQGRRYRHGRLESDRIGGDVLRLHTPDGDVVTTSTMPLGELVAAQRASAAPHVVAASSALPSSVLGRTALSIGVGALAVPPIRRLATRSLQRMAVPEGPAPRKHSWAHAQLVWSDGTATEGWLQLPEAHEATVAIAASVVRRVAAGQGRPGAWTPGALFGSGLVESAGGKYVDLYAQGNAK